MEDKAHKQPDKIKVEDKAPNNQTRLKWKTKHTTSDKIIVEDKAHKQPEKIKMEDKAHNIRQDYS